MAKLMATFSSAQGKYNVTGDSTTETRIVGVGLRREISESIGLVDDSSGRTPGSSGYVTTYGPIGGKVKIRPTNVTAAISTDAFPADPDYILLQNGPKGGFSQFGLTIDNNEALTVNPVIEFVITSA